LNADSSSAHFSACRTWRYSLTREIAALEGKGTCTFVGLNPSTADETKDDPTIRRCMDFARRWGYARLAVVNVYAFRCTDPRALRDAADPVGPENDAVLSVVFAGSDLIVAAWGIHTGEDRVADVMRLPHRPFACLGLTKEGAPRHPLYLPRTTTLIAFGSKAPTRFELVYEALQASA
jgi:hypothetical protein